jgi:hypothetical protein
MAGNPVGSLFQGEMPILCPQAVYMHRSIRGLCRDVFVQRVPRDALDVMAVLSDLSN